MLLPKRVKHRKVQRGRRSGMAKGGTLVSFGEYGRMAEEVCWLTSRQIEAARRAMTHHIKRGGRIWIRVFPDKPVTKKPAGGRVGTHKGTPRPLGGGGQAGARDVRDVRRAGDGRPRGDAAGQPQAPDPDQVRRQ